MKILGNIYTEDFLREKATNRVQRECICVFWLVSVCFVSVVRQIRLILNCVTILHYAVQYAYPVASPIGPLLLPMSNIFFHVHERYKYE